MDFSTIFWDEVAAGEQAMYHDHMMPAAAMLTSAPGPPDRAQHMMDTTQSLIDLVTMNQNNNYFSSNSESVRGEGGDSCPYINNVLGMASAPVSLLSNINHHQPLLVSAPIVRPSPSEAAALATTTALHASDLSQYFSEFGPRIAHAPSTTELLLREQQRQIQHSTTGVSSFDAMEGSNNINNDHHSNPHHRGLNSNWLGTSLSNTMESRPTASDAAAAAGADVATGRIGDLTRRVDDSYSVFPYPTFASDVTEDGLNVNMPPLFGAHESPGRTTSATTSRLCSRRGRSSSMSHIGTAAGTGTNSRDRLARAMQNVADEERERQDIIRRLRVAAVAAAQRPTQSLPLAFNNMSRAAVASATGYDLGGDEDVLPGALFDIARADVADRLATADDLLDAAVLDDAMGPSPAACPSWSNLGGMTASDEIPDGNLTPLELLAQTRPVAEDHPPPPSRRLRRPSRRSTRSTAADRQRIRLTNDEEFMASLTSDSFRFIDPNVSSRTVDVKRESDSEPLSASNEMSRSASGGSLGSIPSPPKKSSSADSTSKEAASMTNPEDDLELIEVRPELDADKKIAAAPAEEDLSLCSGISCCICLDLSSKKDLSMINGCKHKFCFECIEKWSDRENTCPLCKERFSKIERVYKATRRSKKRKSDDPETATARSKNSKRVKNRSQRADYGTGSALHGLLQGMESGALPQTLAQFIFSNIPGGIMNGLARGSAGGAPHGAPRSGAGAPVAAGSVWYYLHSSSTPRGPTTARAASARAGAAAGALPSTTTFRFRAGGSHDPLVQHLDSFNLMGGPAGASGSSHSFLDDELQGDSDFEDLQPSHSSHHLMPPWINPFYSAGGSRGARPPGVSSTSPARSYAANHHEVNAGSSAANALEIIDSDDEDEMIEMVVTHT